MLYSSRIHRRGNRGRGRRAGARAAWRQNALRHERASVPRAETASGNGHQDDGAVRLPRARAVPGRHAAILEAAARGLQEAARRCGHRALTVGSGGQYLDAARVQETIESNAARAKLHLTFRLQAPQSESEPARRPGEPERGERQDPREEPQRSREADDGLPASSSRSIRMRGRWSSGSPSST